MVNEAHEEYKENDDGVIDHEVIEVSPDPRHGFRIVVGSRQGRWFEQFSPWPPRRDKRLRPGSGAAIH